MSNVNYFHIPFQNVMCHSGVDFEAIRDFISKNEGPVDESDVITVLLKLMEILNQENNVVSVPTPSHIVGDLHGQLDDVLYMFERCGSLKPGSSEFKEQRYVFMGDYVDRGYHSLHTFLYLACLKIEFPDSIFLLRGNHESRCVCQRYGFHSEVLLNYGHAGLWTLCNEAFDLLPLSAVVGSTVFCVHGGISPEIPDVGMISLIQRQREAPSTGAVADLLWSDPEFVKEWRPNGRGAGFLFGKTEATKFVRVNRFEFICRSHQLANKGYEEYFGDDDHKYRVITVWSAPNYCYRSGNEAAVMRMGFQDGQELMTFGPAVNKLLPLEEDYALNGYFQ